MKTDKRSLLFICLGNICRSPAAEGIMKKMAADRGLSDQLRIDSARIGSWHVGQLPDARWTEKRNEKFYGYKKHAKVDQRHKMVLEYDTTSANVHASKGYESLLDKSNEGKKQYLDAGYKSQELIVEKHRMKPVICEKGHRNHPLTDEQKKKNREKSKTRCLVEHVFGFMEQYMCGPIFRRVEILRARANVAMTCIVYHRCRYTQIMRLTPVHIA